MLSSSYPCLWSLLKQSMLLNILKHRNSEKLRKLLSHHLKTEPTITQPNEERSLTRRETAAVAARQTGTASGASGKVLGSRPRPLIRKEGTVLSTTPAAVREKTHKPWIGQSRTWQLHRFRCLPAGRHHGPVVWVCVWLKQCCKQCSVSDLCLFVDTRCLVAAHTRLPCKPPLLLHTCVAV